jgi:hypothetical protein
MQASERIEFDEQLGILCAGFNLPVTAQRREAYWRGLGKMSLAQFARCVDYALSDDWTSEDLPSTTQIWSIHRGFRARPAGLVATQDTTREDPRDHLLFYANRMFLRHLVARGGLGLELWAARQFVRSLVEWWCPPIREGDQDATQDEFIRQFATGLHKISPLADSTRLEWETRAADPHTHAAFPPYMGRQLEARYAQTHVSPQASLELTA